MIAFVFFYACSSTVKPGMILSVQDNIPVLASTAAETHRAYWFSLKMINKSEIEKFFFTECRGGRILLPGSAFEICTPPGKSLLYITSTFFRVFFFPQGPQNYRVLKLCKSWNSQHDKKLKK